MTMMTVAGRALDSHPRAGSGDSAYHEGDGDLPSACAEARPGILILGVGNILQKDDGIGVRVIERLMATDVSPRAELLDGGTAGMDLLSEVIGREKVVVVDAVRGGGAPGAVYRFAPESVEEEPYPITSLHQDRVARGAADGKTPWARAQTDRDLRHRAETSRLGARAQPRSGGSTTPRCRYGPGGSWWNGTTPFNRG